MSSHREAPEISKDPVADNTDTYAFVSPDRPDTVTLITNYVPLEGPAGGPNFYEFGDDVRYDINVDNDGDGKPDVTYRFNFKTRTLNPDTFLYNVGPISGPGYTNWNRPQFYSVTKIVAGGEEEVLGTDLRCPPCNIGPNSTPGYSVLAAHAIHDLPSGERVFAGQRNEGFYVDLGSIFDLLDLRPFAALHFSHMASSKGVDATKELNVHTIAIQVPKKDLAVRGANLANPADRKAVIGVWGAASRRKVRIARDHEDDEVVTGPWVQVSRLGNPLFNEVIVPLGDKDRWNSVGPDRDSEFAKYVAHPEVGHLIPGLYPGVFPNLQALDASHAVRDDLLAVLLTGLPPGVVPGFQNYTGPKQADVLRLNMAIPPTPKAAASIYGLLGGDAGGFPNGRRVYDDVVAIEVRAIAGVTYKIVHPAYTLDAAAAVVSDGTEWPMATPVANPPIPGGRYQDGFPYLGDPHDGFHTPSA